MAKCERGKGTPQIYGDRAQAALKISGLEPKASGGRPDHFPQGKLARVRSVFAALFVNRRTGPLTPHLP